MHGKHLIYNAPAGTLASWSILHRECAIENKKKIWLSYGPMMMMMMMMMMMIVVVMVVVPRGGFGGGATRHDGYRHYLK